MTPSEWLGMWEPIEAPGRHTKLYPAGFAQGYQYRACQIDKRPRRADILEEMTERVQRAIPVDGSIDEKTPSWAKSPQARFWLEEPKPSLGERLRAWLRRAA